MARSRRPILSSRINETTGEIEFYEMTHEEAEEAINGFLENLGQPGPVTSKTIEAEARRGAHNAERLLAQTPRQAEIQQAYEWSIEETELCGDDRVSLAYDEAFRNVLRPKLI